MAALTERLVLLNTAIGFEWSRPSAIPALVQWTGPLVLASIAGSTVLGHQSSHRRQQQQPARPSVPFATEYSFNGATVSYEAVRQFIAARMHETAASGAAFGRCVYVSMEGNHNTISRSFGQFLLAALHNESCVLWEISTEQRMQLFHPAESALPQNFLFADVLPRAMLFATDNVWSVSTSAIAPSAAAAAGTGTTRAASGARIVAERGATNRIASDSRSFSPSLSSSIVDVVVSACDMLSTQEAMIAGLPVLCFPHVTDQFDVACRVVTSGSGRKSIHPAMSVHACGLDTDLKDCSAFTIQYPISQFHTDLAAVRNMTGIYRARASAIGDAITSGFGVARALTFLIFSIEHHFDTALLRAFLTLNYPHTSEPDTGHFWYLTCLGLLFPIVFAFVSLYLLYRICIRQRFKSSSHNIQSKIKTT
jgi:hypothetical protein